MPKIDFKNTRTKMNKSTRNINYIKIALMISFIFFVSSCATFKPYESKSAVNPKEVDKKLTHTFYIAGGLGNSENPAIEKSIITLRNDLQKADENSTLIFTGDNISNKIDNWKFDKELIDIQLEIAKAYKGKTIFIPGINEWKSFDTKKIEKGEEYIKDLDIKNVEFLPENVCPIEHRVINDKLDLILIDSRWFVSGWDRIKGINSKCTNVNTRRRFAEELEGYINDGQGKNIIIAMHHPIFSNGKYAGHNSLKNHLLPLPGLGSLYVGVMDLGAFSTERLGNRRYNQFRITMSSLAKLSDRITFVSGHEESVQYLSGGEMHQIISGSLGKKSQTKLTKGKITAVGGELKYKGLFAHGEQGYAKIMYYDDGSSEVQFVYANQKIKSKTFAVLPELNKPVNTNSYAESNNSTYTTSVIANTEELNKTGFYKFLWGNRYRSYYDQPVIVPAVNLDTLYRGLVVEKMGGGHQSYSLRLLDADNKEYAMRSLRKNALKFLRFKLRGISYVEEDYEDTFTEELIADFFTTTHPYMQLVINPLAKAAAINHANTKLFYVPKQQKLGEYNFDFGDELYYIEQRPSDEQKDYEGYRRTVPENPGKISDFESTQDMFEKVMSDESYSVDQRSFIRARIFDMLIGDWDRHADQWRWAEYDFDDSDHKVFMPIPRDRDNTFSKFDGLMFPIIKMFSPDARFWQTYGPTIKNIKWYNTQGNSLDKAIINEYNADAWEEEAKYIQANITDEVIENAFKELPENVIDSTTYNFKGDLKKRLTKLPEYAKQYGEYLNKSVVIHATEKDDLIEIIRLPNSETKIILKRILSDEENKIFYERIFNKNETKEILIYALGDDDIIKVLGASGKNIFVRIIGGYGEDSYEVENKSSIKIYDWKHEKSNFPDKHVRKQMSNRYKTNTLHWRYFKENHNILLPNIGYRTDDGFYLGARNTYTNNGFNRNPFRQKHTLSANYYFNFQGVELSYSGIFANIFPKWNFEINGYFTSQRFVNNFFGIGNETQNLDDDLGKEFNRARMRQIKLNAGIAYHTLRFKAIFESLKVQEMQDRLFTSENVNTNVFDSQEYIGLETSLLYENADADDFPSKSIHMSFRGGYKMNTSITENKFGYMNVKLGFSHKLIPSGNLVISSMANFKTNIGDNYFFYHTQSIGGNNGLRGFRDERFSGKTAFYQNTDLRLRLKRYVTAVAPITIGLYGGFDYGRVWIKNDTSNIWHTSQGGGFWVSAYKRMAFNAGYFNSVEGNIVQVGFGFEY